MNDSKKCFTLILDPQVHKAVKMAAADADMTMADWLGEAIQNLLDVQNEARKARDGNE